MNAHSFTTTTPGDLAPGELARLTAGCLAASGITVTSDGPDPGLGSELQLHPGPDPWLGEQAGEAAAIAAARTPQARPVAERNERGVRR